MDKNFRTRIIVGAGMFIVALVALYTFSGIPFKIIFGLFALLAVFELVSFIPKKTVPSTYLMMVLEGIFLVCSTIFVAKISVNDFWYIILGVPGYDIFAYLSGKLLGGKIFKKSRPFPRISKNKTWEGTILGLIMAISMVGILMSTRGTFSTDWYYLFCGPLALMGDLFESHLKRKCKVKDSNEVIIKKPFFKKLEMIVGGSEGHGGFLDRIDSTAFAGTILLIISSLV